MRKFNTEGPVVADKHYSIPPLERVDLDEVLGLIRDERYFVLHAPRQTGKTTMLLALRDLLNSGAEGDFRCVYVNVETAQAAREDVGAAMRAILVALARQERITLRASHLQAVWREALADAGPHEALQEALGRWAEADPSPLVLLIDEIDTLIGDTLLAVLRQLRAGYPNRPGHYPQSVVLCGIRDVRDYRIRSSAENAVIAGGSAFNATVDVESIPSESPESIGAPAPSARLVTIHFTEAASIEDIRNTLDAIDRKSPQGYQIAGRTSITITLDRG